MTNRNDVEGTLARWFAVDAIGQLGVFTGAYAAWPASVFTDYSIVAAADELLSAVPSVTKGQLTSRQRDLRRSGTPNPLWDRPPTPDFPLVEASQGLFSCDADIGYGGSTVYYLDAFPEVPLLLADAHPAIQRAALLVTFDQVRFSAVEAVDLAEHIPFVQDDSVCEIYFLTDPSCLAHFVGGLRAWLALERRPTGGCC